VLVALASSFDEEFGGFGVAPRFPPITQLELLLFRQFYDEVGVYRKMAEATLTAMVRGGIYDHLLGGFFRYSTDRYWLIPHYEKLLIDNAELLALYAKAYRQFGNPLYRKTAAGIVKWLDVFMRAPGGGVLRQPRRRCGGRGGRLLPLGPRRGEGSIGRAVPSGGSALRSRDAGVA